MLGNLSLMADHQTTIDKISSKIHGLQQLIMHIAGDLQVARVPSYPILERSLHLKEAKCRQTSKNLTRKRIVTCIRLYIVAWGIFFISEGIADAPPPERPIFRTPAYSEPAPWELTLSIHLSCFHMTIAVHGHVWIYWLMHASYWRRLDTWTCALATCYAW